MNGPTFLAVFNHGKRKLDCIRSCIGREKRERRVGMRRRFRNYVDRKPLGRRGGDLKKCALIIIVDLNKHGFFYGPNHC